MTTPPRFSIETLGPAGYPSPLERDGERHFVSDDTRFAYNPHYSCRPAAAATTAAAWADQEGFELAGPRARIFFNPPRTRAAIVTCGGLCPGINAVVRGIVLQLWHRYNCRDILGIRYGYVGLAGDAEPPVPLEPDTVSDIHLQGGTLLGTSRGTPPTAELADYLEKHRIDVLFTVGGDGTMRGAAALWDELKRRGRRIAVVSVPKTIDNDIPFVRRTFGFETAVAVAAEAIHSAHVEADAVPHGIGLVKVMGRQAGYIAATACLAAGQANFCLVPEVPFGLDGPTGLLQLLENRIALRRHAVIVVAEGAGQFLFPPAARRADASGNPQFGDIGVLLKERISGYFSGRDLPVTLKYLDPSYLIRTAAANPTDQLHCARLAQNAVHAAMAGKSGLLIGYWHGLMTHVPTRALAGIRQSINPDGELWFNVLETTGQPPVIGQVPSAPAAAR